MHLGGCVNLHLAKAKTALQRASCIFIRIEIDGTAPPPVSQFHSFSTHIFIRILITDT